MSIPKIIHYCWFGDSNKPKDIVKYMDTWNKLKDFKIMEWNEDNFDINCNKYVKENYLKGKYAFVSDYVRLLKLYEFGGIYLDTDMEIKKSFDDFLSNKMFLGFMFDCNLGTAVIGAERYNVTIKKILDLYDNNTSDNSPNNDLFTRFFLENYVDFKLNNKYQIINNSITIYPKEYFERPTYNKSMGYSIHHYKGSWYNKKDSTLKKITKIILGNVIYSRLSHYRALKTSPFYKIYLKHKKE